MFHRICKADETYFLPPMAMSESHFSRIVRWLAKFDLLADLNEASDHIRLGILKGKKVALTFDDGYRDNLDIASKILHRYGAPATFFIPVNQIDRGDPYWWDFLNRIVMEHRRPLLKWLEDPERKSIQNAIEAAPKEMPLSRRMVQALNSLSQEARLDVLKDLEQEFGAYSGRRMLMTWDEIRRLKEEGFSIGSHTLSHVPLTDLPEEAAAEEITSSKAELAERIGGDIRGFSYPRGAWSPRLSEITEQAGYAYAVGTVFGSNRPGCDLFRLNRRNMEDYSGLRRHTALPMHFLEMTGMLDRLLARRR